MTNRSCLAYRPSALQGPLRYLIEKTKTPVSVGNPVLEGETQDGERILRMNYSYRITGVDFGLQRFPHLLLDVSGSCVTDYTWYKGTRTPTYSNSTFDHYVSPIDEYDYNVSPSDSMTPSALFDFYYPEHEFSQTIRWAAIPSSVNRTSVSLGEDPWYLTASSGGDNTSNASSEESHIVKPARPVLLCSENDAWSFGMSDQTFSISDVNNTILANSGLPEGLLDTMRFSLDLPAIFYHGIYLGKSALLCGSESHEDGVIDASRCSVHADLKQLVFGAYIATIKLFTDTTLYPRRGEGLANWAMKENTTELRPGMDDFVVYTEEVVALYVPALILIPALALGTWVLMIVLLAWTPLKLARSMEATQIFQEAHDRSPNMRLDTRTGVWKFNEPKPASNTASREKS